MSSKGRPQVYTDEQLLETLNKYIEENPDRLIKYPALERATGIPQHIWKYRMRPYIDKYNHNHKQCDVSGIDVTRLPSADDMIRIANGNPNALKLQLEMLLDLVMRAEKYKYAAETLEEMKIKHEEEMEEYKVKNKEQAKKIEQLEEMLGCMMLDSQYPDRRKEKGIKDNMLAFTKDGVINYEELLKNFNF